MAGRPLTGETKRVKFTTTVDSALISVARECARDQHMTLPALIEKLLEAEIKRRAATAAALAAVDELVAESRLARKTKDK